MAALTTLGSGTGFIYVVDLDGTSIIQNLANTTNTVKQILLDASTSVGLSGRAGIYDSSYGKRYFLDASGVAGVLSGTEITQFVVSRGLDSTIPVNSYTIASGVVTPLRYAAITIVNIDTEGAAASDTLDTITTTEYNTGDIIIFRGANAGRVVTFSDGSGNLLLANDIDFVTGATTSAIALQYISGTGFVELWRTPSTPLTIANLRGAGVAAPNWGVANSTMPTNGTVQFEPGVSVYNQVITGSPALIGSVVYEIDPTPTTAYLDGDEMWLDYRATPTGVGANTVTIFGITLTTDQAEGGRVSVKTSYDLDTTTWFSELFYRFNGIDPATTTDLADYEPELGDPAADGYALTSTAAGVRSWSLIAPNGSVLQYLYANTQTGANTTLTTLATYDVVGDTLATDGDAIFVEATFLMAANGNTKTVRIIFANEIMAEYVSTTSGETVNLTAKIVRDSAGSFLFVTGKALTSAGDASVTWTGYVAGFSSDITLDIKGLNGTASAGDITLNDYSVTLYRKLT